jgi:hypothetical protein
MAESVYHEGSKNPENTKRSGTRLDAFVIFVIFVPFVTS